MIVHQLTDGLIVAWVIYQHSKPNIRSYDRQYYELLNLEDLIYSLGLRLLVYISLLRLTLLVCLISLGLTVQGCVYSLGLMQ